MRLLILLLSAALSGTSACAQRYSMSGGEVVPEQAITFAKGSTQPDAASAYGLASLKKYLDDKPYVSMLRIEGHVAESESSAKNQTLSEARALAVCSWLVSHGIDCKRLIAVGFGDTKPVAATADGNTRIACMNAALRGHLIGGSDADGGGHVAGEACPE